MKTLILAIIGLVSTLTLSSCQDGYSQVYYNGDDGYYGDPYYVYPPYYYYGNSYWYGHSHQGYHDGGRGWGGHDRGFSNNHGGGHHGR